MYDGTSENARAFNVVDDADTYFYLYLNSISWCDDSPLQSLNESMLKMLICNRSCGLEQNVKSPAKAKELHMNYIENDGEGYNSLLNLNFLFNQCTANKQPFHWNPFQRNNKKNIHTYKLLISFMNIKRKRISVLMISTFLPESKFIYETPPNIINWYNPTKVNINKWMTIDLIESKHLISFPDTIKHIRNLRVAILIDCTLSVHIYHHFYHRWRHYECTFANR